MKKVFRNYLEVNETSARLMNPYIDSEKNRVGVKLITDKMT